ncbi:unnamed protein product [Schistocephalus solidus]|uniref:Microtub_bd domain-containing protein n=1 Tax=Schistocephalus solidus TaxID=70667 RepID=A0A183T032_SCHSO|nr:unnamed protein product [Schistocephalus solidus]
MGSEIADLKKKLFNAAVERESLCSKISGLQDELRQANARLNFLQTMVPELQEKVLRREAIIETLMRDRELNAARDIQTRMMRTELMNLKGQIRLLVRCSPDEEPRGCIDILNENSIIIRRPYEELQFNKKRGDQFETIEVYRVFKPGGTQSDVFKDVEDYIVSAVDGKPDIAEWEKELGCSDVSSSNYKRLLLVPCSDPKRSLRMQCSLHSEGG